MIYHHSSLHFRQSYFLNHEREEQQESQESHCYQNKICFMSSSFCQNVIIYIIVYANHSLPPEIDKVLSWLVSLLAEEGHIMDKRTEKNGVHFCDATIPPGHLFSLFLSVICICQDWARPSLIWITVCTQIWTGGKFDNCAVKWGHDEKLQLSPSPIPLCVMFQTSSGGKGKSLTDLFKLTHLGFIPVRTSESV